MEIFEKEYVSTAETFLLPLTGLTKQDEQKPKCYLFWKDYSIENYQLILMYEYEDPIKMHNYLTEHVFPILDRKLYILENYDIQGRCILILDLSEWALDIQMFLDGKYSKLSKEAKTAISKFHRGDSGKPIMSVFVALYPNESKNAFNGKTAIEYVAEEYGMNLELLRKVGELGIKYVKLSETLLTEIEDITRE